MGVGGGDRPAWPGWSQGEDLTALEEQMVARAAVGELVDRGGGPFNLAEMQAWGEERTIRAVVLRHLLVAEQWPVDAKGVRLRGVRISGHLNLEAAVLRCPLSLDDCHLDAAEPACLDFATASRITMAGCQLAGLTGEMLTAREVDLSRSTFTGPLRLTVADITGQLNCRGARLAGRDSEGHALYADRLKAGAVYLSEGFTAPGGAVRLLGADITGPLICRGALLNGGDGVNNALAADGLKVGGGVFLDEGFTATGAVRLAGGHITGQLSCRDAQLIGCDDEDNALVADRLKASGGVFLDGKFTAPGAVRLLGADITGQLCCRGARLTGYDRDGNALVADWLKASGGVFLDKGFTAAGAVRLLGADITGQLECSGARLTGHDSDGCALVANGMRVTGEAFFTGLTAAGAVQMLAADIEGQLSFHGAHLNGRDNNDPALIADGMRVTNGAFFTGLTATGAVRMLAADIERQLTFQGAHLNGRDDRGDALAADGMKVRGSVLFNGVSTAIGAVRLPGADISGPLVCSDAQLTGRDQGRNALVADRMKVGSGVSLNGQFTADGAVRLAGADITGQLTCRGAQLNGCDDRGDALAAYGMRVSDDVYIDEGFTAAGTLSLVAARFGGSVEFKPATLASEGQVALDMARAQVAGAFWWAPTAQVSGRVDLEGAAFGELADDWGEGRGSANGYWPTAGRLRLNGFTYDRLGGNHQPPVKQRLEWVRSQYSRYKPKPTVLWTNGTMAPPVITSPPARAVGEGSRSFTPEPYEQLAKVYRQAGEDREAREVAIARLVDERRYGDLDPFRNVGNWFFDKTIKFGYQTRRALLGLVFVFVAFLVMTFFAQHHHAIEPVNDLVVGVHPTPVATRCAPSYPCFYPLGYAVDVVIPIINVHQTDFWGLNGWGWVFGSWAATVLGWSAVTLLVVGYTGLVRQQ